MDDNVKIIANTAGSAGLGSLIPSILEAVPPKYQPIATAGISALILLIGLFQNKPSKKSTNLK